MFVSAIAVAWVSIPVITHADELNIKDAPRGVYVVSGQNCADLAKGLVPLLGMLEFDGAKLYQNKGECKIFDVKHSGSVIDAQCGVRGGKTETIQFSVARPDANSILIDNNTYHYCGVQK